MLTVGTNQRGAVTLKVRGVRVLLSPRQAEYLSFMLNRKLVEACKQLYRTTNQQGEHCD